MGWLEALGQIATAVGVLIAAYTIWQSGRINKNQANMQAFLAYTERFESVMERFPEGSLASRLDLDAAPVVESAQLTLAALLYLNLVSEEYYLLKAGYLAQGLWNIWETEIQRTIASPLFVREWKKVRGEFTSYPAFQEYVEHIQQPTRHHMTTQTNLHASVSASSQSTRKTEHPVAGKGD